MVRSSTASKNASEPRGDVCEIRAMGNGTLAAPRSRMSLPSDHHRLVEKLARELIRGEARAIDYADREERRIGATPPVVALREVGRHASDMAARLDRALDAHGFEGSTAIRGPAWVSMQWLARDRMLGAERAFRAALIDLRQCIELVRVLRDAARLDELFAVIRWCDDWLAVRRMLVARVEANQAWFAEQSLRP